ncbi:MAG TPA: IS21 family transposase [Hyphomicrobiaceae bacterium]|nr:IS21 family transposase [Hyphomicrobiaceae bacterium]
MAKLDGIVALYQRRWSIRRIAKELGVHRDTVARHIQANSQASDAPASDGGASNCKLGHPAGGAHGCKIGHPRGGAQDFKIGQALIGSAEGAEGSAEDPANALLPAPSIGSEASLSVVPAAITAAVMAPTESTSPGKQVSLCESWRSVIVAKLQLGLTAQRIYQDLVREHGFVGKYHSVRRFVRRLDDGQPLPFRRLECAPGDEAQVDFGTAIPIRQSDGRQRRTHVFRIVLSHSRKGYSEAVYRQTTEEFLRCLENALYHFGGVPKTLVLDNLKAGVEQPDWFDPELNPKLRSFAEHYGLAVLPTKPRTPRHKGKIESGVGYVKKNALQGCQFTSLEEENRHLLDWETTVADVRIHGTIRQQVGKVFIEMERPALQPLPAERFPFFEEGRRTVHRDGHVEVARAYYSVPPEYLGRQVWVRWDGRLVRILDQKLTSIAVHVRVEVGKFSTQPLHIADQKISAVERGAEWLLVRVGRIGPMTTRWAEAMLANRGIEGVRVLQGLRHLGERHPHETLEKACEIALSHASYRLRTLRQLLKRAPLTTPSPEVFAFMHEHALIRPLTDYSQFVHAAIQGGTLP